MTWPHFSFNVDLGQMLVAGSVSALGWGLRKSYKFVAHQADRVVTFIERTNEDNELLEATTSVVDGLSKELILKEILDGPIVRLNRRKRSTDPAVFTKGNLS